MENAWTYGFEIEGLFTKKIYTTLGKLSCDIKRKGDGSVHVSEIMSQNGVDRDDLDSCTEYNVGIFNNQEDLITAVEVFKNKKNYFMDESCGLHLHIKPKFLGSKEVFWDFTLIEKLEKYAFSTLCKCQAKRKRNRFCDIYRSNDDLIYETKNYEKYRFVRNHPSGTLEFRFFSPCEHKVDNIQKFLKYLFRLLDKQEAKKSEIIELIDRKDEYHSDYSFAIELKSNKNYSYKLGVKEHTTEDLPEAIRRMTGLRFTSDAVRLSEEEDVDDGTDDEEREIPF
jgi:hypothetical protein